MSEQESKIDAKLLLKVANDLRTLADSVQAVCEACADGRQEPVKKAAEITLEKVRGVLADKSRDGYTAEVREIINSFGAERLSEIDPGNYAEILKRGFDQTRYLLKLIRK